MQVRKYAHKTAEHELSLLMLLCVKCAFMKRTSVYNYTVKRMHESRTLLLSYLLLHVSYCCNTIVNRSPLRLLQCLHKTDLIGLQLLVRLTSWTAMKSFA
jgi:hypothetical protein